MKKQTTTPIFVFDNCEVNYIIMYRNNVDENYHVKIFSYEWNTECYEWYKELFRHETFLSFKSAYMYFKMTVRQYLV